jgi:hypothetical protein
MPSDPRINLAAGAGHLNPVALRAAAPQVMRWSSGSPAIQVVQREHRGGFMSLPRIQRASLTVALICGFAGPQTAMGQTDSVVAELDAFWAGVVKSVTQWSIPAQKATYHPDAVGAYGTAGSYTTRLIWADFAAREADSASTEDPRRQRILEFRFSSRVHDASTAHEVGLYHFWAEGRDHYYGTVDSYLVKKDGRWVILVEIQFEPPVTKADWDALQESPPAGVP